MSNQIVSVANVGRKVFAAIRNKIDMKEIPAVFVVVPVLLVLLAAFLPILIVGAVLRDESTPSPPFFIVTFITFLFYLISLHVLFFLLRKRSPKSIGKITEYIYLTLAIVALTKTLQLEFRFNSLPLDNLNMQLTSLEERIKSNFKLMINPCDQPIATIIEGYGYTYGNLCEYFKDLSDNIGGRGVYHDPDRYYYYYADLLKEPRQQVVQDQLDNFHRYADLKGQKSKIWDDEYAAIMTEIAGFAILALAIALRMTKVTVELFHWHRSGDTAGAHG